MPKFIFSKQAKKTFHKLPKQVQIRVVSKLALLKKHEDIFLVVKKMTDTKNATHRLRVGSYRLILVNQKEDTFLVIDVDHRKNIYK